MNDKYEFLITRREGAVEYLTLNRPEVRNAFNVQMIADLTAWATKIYEDEDVRCVVVAGAGKTFCAGADIGWLSQAVEFTHDENVQDANAAERMFMALDTLPVPLIGRIHGAAVGGGAGLASICDVAVTEEHAVFGFAEVKLGILPAVISPYVLAKIGRSATRELFLTGIRFGAQRAKEIGLVHAVVAAGRLDATVAMYVNEVLASGPEAIATAKALIPRVWARGASDAAGQTAEAIAAQRVSAEGQEGLRAFLEKRKAKWNISE